MNRLWSLAALALAGWLVCTVPARAQQLLAGDNPHGDLKGMECTVCHSTTAWMPLAETLQFRHGPDTGFELEGAHATLGCADCHGLEFAGLPTDCEGCHTDVHAGSAGVDCQRCHNQASWRDEGGFRRAHDGSTFPLTGAHQALSCTACHAGQNFSEAPGDCAGCHSADYLRTQTPNHTDAGFATDCTGCHSAQRGDWSSSFDHPAAFPLTGGHDGPACNACHLPGQPASAVEHECEGCHVASTLVSDPDHTGSRFAGSCVTCHTTTAWTPADFDHALSAFPLTGLHVPTDCNACHLPGASPRFTGLSSDCAACHQADADATPDPDHSRPSLAGDCAVCHVTDGWSPAEYDHSLSDFPLTGVHVETTCTDCHTTDSGERFSGLDDACAACHQAEADETTDPDHTTQALSGDCAACHTTDGWAPAEFDHALSDWPLTGAHIETDCNDCHGLEAVPRFSGLLDTCTGCHQAAADELPDPDHSSPALGTDCALCHTTDAWLPAEFDHTRSTFALTGAHIATDCAACHGEGEAAVFSGLDATCFACHQQDYDGAQNPDHNNPALPTDCQVCHSTTAWEPAEFDHQLTDFPLTGAHAEIDCNACHTGGIYEPIDAACVACHLDDYNNTEDPDHAGENLPLDCALCHNTSDWEDADFDHGQTRFPLQGAHQPLACVACHADGYTDTPFACQACHLDDWQGAALPHEEQSFTLECATCHTQDAWAPSTFNHDNLTDWPLTGAHGSVSCTACHTGGTYLTAAPDCWGCHQQDYLDADEPDHEGGSYPQDCAVCHSTGDWVATAFDHALTEFPLLGAHTTVACIACHEQGYVDTPTACRACHQADWDNAAPVHDEGTFQWDCTRCHNQSVWSPSTFSHTTMTEYPLTGQHVSTSCVSCHPGGQYENTPDECLFCHQTDFNNANDPDHSGEGYPDDCTMCHSTQNWNSNFNHGTQYFPIYNGEHNNEWDTCTDCHLQGGNMSTFSCTHCHEHRQSAMDNEHDDEPGYVWESGACLECHPNGDGDNVPGLRRHPGLDGTLKDWRDL